MKGDEMKSVAHNLMNQCNDWSAANDQDFDQAPMYGDCIRAFEAYENAKPQQVVIEELRSDLRFAVDTIKELSQRGL